MTRILLTAVATLGLGLLANSIIAGFVQCDSVGAEGVCPWANSNFERTF